MANVLVNRSWPLMTTNVFGPSRVSGDEIRRSQLNQMFCIWARPGVAKKVFTELQSEFDRYSHWIPPVPTQVLLTIAPQPGGFPAVPEVSTDLASASRIFTLLR